MRKPDLETLYNTPAGKKLAARFGLAEPPTLRRGRTAPAGDVALVSIAGADLAARTLALLGVTTVDALVDTLETRTTDERGRPQAPRYERKLGALVVDLTAVTRVAELEQLRAVLRPVVRGLAGSGRVILIGRRPEGVDGLEARAVQTGLEGVIRTVGKELRGGSTANLVQVTPGTTPEGLASSVRFLLEGRSAFVDGQVWQVGEGTPSGYDSDRPFSGRVVAVTGAARGIGAAIARTLGRDGAQVIAIDIAASGESLSTVANEIGGTALALDVTAPDAGQTIARHVAERCGERLYAIVHCAGITRDKLLGNLDDVKWAQVLEVNLVAQLRINDVLLDPGVEGGLADGGRIVGISSTSGIAGNKGQTNYAASKAGVIGIVQGLAPVLAPRGITVNAVAPGFIETDMTAAIPFVQREIFRRTNSLSQGGQPVDVAETICWLADPASQAISGQIVRVCGQNLVGR